MERGTPMEKTIAVLGGDRRMALLARLLAEDGHPVRTWGLAAFGMEDCSRCCVRSSASTPAA